MDSRIKMFELQIDYKPNGAVIRLNDENGCVLRICGIPKKLCFNARLKVKESIDIAYPKPNKKKV